MKVYISGPMTGLPDFNRPAFAEAAAALLAAGHEPINPHDVPTADGVVDPQWLDYMRTDVAALSLLAEGLATLEGWSTSRGAQIEVRLATDLGLDVRTLDGWLAEWLES